MYKTRKAFFGMALTPLVVMAALMFARCFAPADGDVQGNRKHSAAGAELKSLTLTSEAAVMLVPEFDPAVLDYTVYASEFTTDKPITVMPEPTENARFTINGEDAGSIDFPLAADAAAMNGKPSMNFYEMPAPVTITVTRAELTTTYTINRYLKAETGAPLKMPHAAGGALKFSGDDEIHTFTNASAPEYFEFLTASRPATMRVLVLGGGGGGGGWSDSGNSCNGGGGGAGQLVENESFEAGESRYKVAVGSGGSGGGIGSSHMKGKDGKPSLFGEGEHQIKAEGGGGGSPSEASPAQGGAIVDGVPQGGQAGYSYDDTGGGGAGTAGNGSEGGAGGAGGDGKQSIIAGSSEIYGRGGAGVNAWSRSSAYGGNAERPAGNGGSGGNGVIIVRFTRQQ